MDKETKDTLDSLFETITVDRKTRRSTGAARPSDSSLGSIKRAKEERDRLRREHSKTEEAFTKSFDTDWKPTPRREASTSSEPSGSFEQAKLVNTRSETATLALNTSKACIVFRAVLSNEVISNIKETIPSKLRFWNERDKVWEFNPICIKELKSLLGILYADVQVVGVPKALPATKFDKLIAKLDKDDKSKLYRLLAAKYHPDVKGSGSHDVMTLINEVFKQ